MGELQTYVHSMHTYIAHTNIFMHIPLSGTMDKRGLAITE